jgi:hypothetical protein
VLETLNEAVAATAMVFAQARVREDQFTRQLLLDFQRSRDARPSTPRYDITHQPELPIADPRGAVGELRRLDLRLLFPQQVGRTGDYLCIECKYLDTADRATDLAYVRDGVERIVSGVYAKAHPWAIMVGLERTGPLTRSAERLNERLIDEYGPTAGLKPASTVKLAAVHESDHQQAGGSHVVTILHSLHLIVAHPPPQLGTTGGFVTLR